MDEMDTRDIMNATICRTGVVFLFTALCLTGCKEGDGKKETTASRAPEMVRQESKQAPVLPAILELGRKMKEGQMAYDAVRQGMFALPRELSRSDATALLDLLMTPPAPGWNELGWAAIFNDGLNVLRQGANQPEGFMERLLECYRDENRPAVLRDYALQHFGTQLAAWYHDPGNGKKLFPKVEVRQQAEEALRRALLPGKGTTMGTACNVADDIITACKASGTSAPFSVDDLCRSCKETALSTAENIHARITALGMLGRHESPAVLKEARLWMMDEGQPVLFRAAAIAYVGKFPAENDRAALNTLAADTDLRLSQPAKKSLARLEGRS